MTSSGTFSAIIAADTYSRRFEEQRNPAKRYQDESTSLQQAAEAQKSTKQRTMDWLSKNRYSVVFGSWVASMGTALGIVGRNPYLTGQQKLVQARVYAQGLTIAVVIISLAFETSDSRSGQGRWETVQVLDESDPSHQRMVEKKIHHERYQGEDQWRDMVEAEEQRIKEREEAVKAQEARDKKLNGKVKKVNKPDLEHGKPEEAKAQEVRAP